MSATGHHVVSFVTITEMEISEIEKSVLVANSRPARVEATKGPETWCAVKLVICLSLGPPALRPASATVTPAVDQDASNLRLSYGFV